MRRSSWESRGRAGSPPGDLVVPRRDGTATTEIGDMQGVSTVMVTTEPRGGSAAPTSEPLVSIAVPQ